MIKQLLRERQEAEERLLQQQREEEERLAAIQKAKEEAVKIFLVFLENSKIYLKLRFALDLKDRLAREKKEREKQRKKERDERLKAEGKYLTPAQKEKLRRQQALLNNESKFVCIHCN